MTSYRRATLLATAGTAIPLIYPQSLVFALRLRDLMRSESMGVGRMDTVVGAFAQFLPALAMTVFFAGLALEVLRRLSARGRQAVAMVAAILLAPGVLFQTLGTYRILAPTLTSSHLTAPTIPFLLAGAVLQLTPLVFWLALFAVFAVVETPLLKPATGILAAVLAVLIALQGMQSVFVASRISFPGGRLLWSWTLLVGLSLHAFQWVSHLLFVVVVWRSGAARTVAGELK